MIRNIIDERITIQHARYNVLLLSCYYLKEQKCFRLTVTPANTNGFLVSTYPQESLLHSFLPVKRYSKKAEAEATAYYKTNVHKLIEIWKNRYAKA
jgi:hypothetical protein